MRIEHFRYLFNRLSGFYLKKHIIVFTKGTHFKANSFIKAVKTAKMKGKDFDDAADKWLKKNQKEYGYKYYRKKN